MLGEHKRTGHKLNQTYRFETLDVSVLQLDVCIQGETQHQLHPRQRCVGNGSKSFESHAVEIELNSAVLR